MPHSCHNGFADGSNAQRVAGHRAAGLRGKAAVRRDGATLCHTAAGHVVAPGRTAASATMARAVMDPAPSPLHLGLAAHVPLAVARVGPGCLLPCLIGPMARKRHFVSLLPQKERSTHLPAAASLACLVTSWVALLVLCRAQAAGGAAVHMPCWACAGRGKACHIQGHPALPAVQLADCKEDRTATWLLNNEHN